MAHFAVINRKHSFKRKTKVYKVSEEGEKRKRNRERRKNTFSIQLAVEERKRERERGTVGVLVTH